MTTIEIPRTDTPAVVEPTVLEHPVLEAEAEAEAEAPTIVTSAPAGARSGQPAVRQARRTLAISLRRLASHAGARPSPHQAALAPFGNVTSPRW